MFGTGAVNVLIAYGTGHADRHLSGPEGRWRGNRELWYNPRAGTSKKNNNVGPSIRPYEASAPSAPQHQARRHENAAAPRPASSWLLVHDY